MTRLAFRSPNSERGQALVEYAMIIALVGACLVAILGLVGHAARNTYDRSASQLAHQTNAGYGASGGGSSPVGSSGGSGGGGPRVIPASTSAADGGDSGTPPDSVSGSDPDSLGTIPLIQ